MIRFFLNEDFHVVSPVSHLLTVTDFLLPLPICCLLVSRQDLAVLASDVTWTIKGLVLHCGFSLCLPPPRAPGLLVSLLLLLAHAASFSSSPSNTNDELIEVFQVIHSYSLTWRMNICIFWKLSRSAPSLGIRPLSCLFSSLAPGRPGAISDRCISPGLWHSTDPQAKGMVPPRLWEVLGTLRAASPWLLTYL